MSGGWFRKTILLLGTGLAVFVCFRYLLSLLVPFLLAFFIAGLLRRPVNFLRKRLHIPAVISGSAGIFLLLSAMGLGAFFLIRSLLGQIVHLFSELPIYRSALLSRYESICAGCDRFLRLDDGTIHLFLTSQLEELALTIQTNVLPTLTEQSLRLALGSAELFALSVIVIVSALLLIKDMEEYLLRYRASFLAPLIGPVLRQLRSSGFAYLRTQAIIMSLIAAICTVALMIIKNPYALLIGIIIAVLDAFPILGSGTVLLPWCVILCFQREFFSAAILLTAFVICLFLREFLEPKLFGKGIGIRPLYTLAAMYVGIRVFGVIGFLLGPLGLVIIKSIWDQYAGE